MYGKRLVAPPIQGDLAEIIGGYAERIENRSLLLNKFVIHKSWPAEYDLEGKPIKWDDASRWSFIRATQDGPFILHREKETQERTVNGRNAKDLNRDKAQRKADVLDRLINPSCMARELSDEMKSLRKARVDHLVALFRNGDGCNVVEAELKGRLAINLSDSLVPNAGICLDRMFGVPYIPGSAVKGICRHTALFRLRSGELSIDDFRNIFGTSVADFTDKGELGDFADAKDRDGNAIKRDQKGCIDFLSAYPIDDAKIVVDISTVHYPKYYGSGEVSDLGNESPLPNSFPVVEKGCKFAFPLRLNGMVSDHDALAKAKELLICAIENVGVGAKTAAGYGWFYFDEDAEKNRAIAEERKKNKERVDVICVNFQTIINRNEEVLSKESVSELEVLKSELDAIDADDAAKQRADDLYRQLKNRMPGKTPEELLKEEWSKAPSVESIVTSDKFKKFKSRSNDEKLTMARVLLDPGNEVLKFINDDARVNSLKKKHLKDVRGAIQEIRSFIKANGLKK